VEKAPDTFLEYSLLYTDGRCRLSQNWGRQRDNEILSWRLEYRPLCRL